MESKPVKSLALDGCREACHRCIQVIAFLCDAEPLTKNQLARVGPHFRHTIDFMRAFFRGLATGSVDYDARDRDPQLESSLDKIREAFEGLEREFAALDPATVHDAIRVCQQAGPQQEQSIATSSIERELAFLSAHAIHHLAIIGLTAEQLDRPVPAELLFAYSTAAYLAANRA